MQSKKIKLRALLILSICALLIVTAIIVVVPMFTEDSDSDDPEQKETNTSIDSESILVSEDPLWMPSQNAVYYYVSSSGSDSNKGTLEKPFKTIQHGISALNPGDVLYLRDGTYNEKIVVSKSGTKNNLITIQNYKDEKVVIDGGGTSGIGISIKNQSFVRIQGLEVCNFSSSSDDTPTGISIDGYGDQIELINNKVYKILSDKNAHSIAVYGRNGDTPLSNVLLLRNTVYDCKLGQSEAMVLNGNVEKFKVVNNNVHDNDNIGIDCIGFEGTAPINDQTRNGVIKGNTVYNISSKNNKTYEDLCAGGIYVDGGKDLVIENNKVYSSDIGIEVASEHSGKATDNVTVRNNIVYKCEMGLAFGGAGKENGFADKCLFIGNTLVNNKTGILIQQSKTNIVKNNIIFGESLVEGEAGSNNFSYNLWYSSQNDKKYPGSNSKFADPKFKDVDKFNFRLTNSSPAIDLGDPAEKDSSLKGIDGNSRISNSRIDCGAYEYK